MNQKFQHENASGSVVFSSFMLSIHSFALVFLCCEFGQKLSDAFDEIDYVIGQMYWYRLPLNLWKMLPFAIEAAHEPIRLRVFGSTSCARADFQAVCTILHVNNNEWKASHVCPISGGELWILLLYGPPTIRKLKQRKFLIVIILNKRLKYLWKTNMEIFSLNY